jgi:DNA-binding transcriptional LysR family regulator
MLLPELGVAHGAVSRQVRHLETVLGVRLFEGPKNRLALADAGRASLPHLTAALDLMEAGVRGVADEEAGTLDVSRLGTLTMRWLIPRLHVSRRAIPASRCASPPQTRRSTSPGSATTWRSG